MRYVRIPAPVVLLDLVTGEPGSSVTFAQAIRLTLAAMVNEMDALTIIDIARAVERAPVGEVIEVTDEHWAPIGAKLKRPTMLSAAYVLVAEPHLRAWLDAPTTIEVVP